MPPPSRNYHRRWAPLSTRKSNTRPPRHGCERGVFPAVSPGNSAYAEHREDACQFCCCFRLEEMRLNRILECHGLAEVCEACEGPRPLSDTETPATQAAVHLCALSPRYPNGCGVPGRSVKLFCASGRSVDLLIPPYAKREQRFSAEGGRKPKVKGGSGVKDERYGGAPGLHKRGFASAEDRGGAVPLAAGYP